MDGAAVIAAYRDLWQVEKSFRMSKSDLRARPIFHHQRDAIEEHLTVVFAALAVSRYLQNVTGVSISKLVRTLRRVRSVTVRINDTEITLDPDIPPAAHNDSRRQVTNQLARLRPDHVTSVRVGSVVVSLRRKIQRTGQWPSHRRRGRSGACPAAVEPAGSAQVRHVDAGSCNGCEVEIGSAFGSVYDGERYGARLLAWLRSMRSRAAAIGPQPPRRG